MGNRIADMTTSEVKQAMSIAGDPDKFMAMMQEILAIMAKANDKNAAELINLEFLMQRLWAESKTWIKMYEQRTKQKIL